MADDIQQAAVSTSFPAPPQYYQYFTEENIACVEELRKVHGDALKTEKELLTLEEANISNLPSGIQYLLPPAPPDSDKFTCFGDQYTLSEDLPSLEQQGIPQLYPSPSPSDPLNFDHAFHLRKLVRSVLLNYLELVGILATCPEEYGPKMENIRHIFINIHHLINVYRPHQARESLIMNMEAQLAKKKEEIANIRGMKDNVFKLLENLANATSPLEHGQQNTDIDPNLRQEDVSKAKDVWAALDKELPK